MSSNIAIITPNLRLDSEPGVGVNGQPLKTAGMGGAYEGADRLGREMATWNARVTSADGALGMGDKLMLDARSQDVLRNSGNMQGASYVHQDSIVGSQFRLNAKPDLRILKLDDVWATEFQAEVEAKWEAWAESDLDFWADATRRMTFTDMIRLSIGCFFAGGEVLAIGEWRNNRPLHSCLRFIDCDRLSNPNDRQDTAELRRGIEYRRGEAVAAHIRTAHPRDRYAGADSFKWDRIPFRLRWGRGQVLHVLRTKRPGQSRGVSDMAAVLKEVRMAKSFHEVSLQNAIVQATYAAAIESELPSNLAFESIGGQDAATFVSQSVDMLEAIAAFSRGGKNLEIDGVKIPHLFPGSKLKLLPAGTVGNVGQSFEESLNRYISAGLDVSYEEYTHDYSKTNYSSAKAAMNNTRRAVMSRKRLVADRTANFLYSLFLEEMITEGHLDSMPRNAPDFYEGFNKAAYCRASWIGSSAGQVDEMKETQAAVMRINAGLSTLEIECARLGNDYREVLEQLAREQKTKKALGIELNGGATKPGTMNTQRGGNANNANNANDDDQNATAYDDGFGDLS